MQSIRQTGAAKQPATELNVVKPGIRDSHSTH